MTWEQAVIAIMLLLGLVIGTAQLARDRDIDNPTLVIFLHILIYVFFTMVLHSGGFW